MSEYDDINTPVLKETIAQQQMEIDSLVPEKVELERRLTEIRAKLAALRDGLRKDEAELRSREPEFGGTYQHKDGFGYQSFRGRKLWEYRIIGTTVSAQEGDNQDGYVFYEPRCSEHGRAGFGNLSLQAALSDAYRHYQKQHVEVVG